MRQHHALPQRPLASAAVTLALFAALSPATARADQPLWELGLGVGWLHLPHYRGSDQSRNWLLPIPYFQYRGEIFRADREGAHALLVNEERLKFDLSLSFNTPTRSQDNLARAGLPNLAPTLELGPSVKWVLGAGRGSNGSWGLDLRLPVRAVFSLEKDARLIGTTASPVLNYDWSSQGWDTIWQIGPVAASRGYNRYFYGVPTASSTASRPAYEARGGAGGWAATALASRRFGDVWLGTYAQYDSLAGATFNASPLVRARSNFSVGVGLSYVFAVSQTRVPDDR